MDDIILHHYPLSPYAEKIRTILGYKKLAWRSVIIPVIMPKPDVVALTGGYRKTPIMQLGRDIYCDTRLIARVLDRIAASPPLVPANAAMSCIAFTQLEPILFLTGVAATLQPAGLAALAQRMGTPETLEAFRRDRAALFSGGTTSRPEPWFAKLHFAHLFSSLESQLAATPFLLGNTPTLADFTVHHPVWFVKSNPGVASMLDPFPNVVAWTKRIAEMGHGQPTELPAADAIEAARSARDAQPFEGALLEWKDVRICQRVAIHATDYGVDRIEGELLHISDVEVAISRTDARAGQLTVHFPREGFQVEAGGENSRYVLWPPPLGSVTNAQRSSQSTTRGHGYGDAPPASSSDESMITRW